MQMSYDTYKKFVRQKILRRAITNMIKRFSFYILFLLLCPSCIRTFSPPSFFQ